MFVEFGLKRELVNAFGFTQVRDGEYLHPSGVRAYVHEHSWSLNHDTEGWTECASLDDLTEFYETLKYCGIEARRLKP